MVMRSVRYGVLILMGGASVAFAEELPGNKEVGTGLYRTHCVNCHGVKGKGDGPVASSLTPPPADLTQKNVQQKSDRELEQIIQEGKAGTSMPAWKGELSGQQIQDVLGYLRTFGE